MNRITIFGVMAMLLLGFLAAIGSGEASAQQPAAVTTYYPPQPVVTYRPVRRGLFGLRRGYVPTVSYTSPSALTSYYAPAAPVTTYYAPSAPTVTYYAPSAPVTTYYAPSTSVTTYNAPSPVTTYYAPSVTAAVTTLSAPACGCQ